MADDLERGPKLLNGPQGRGLPGGLPGVRVPIPFLLCVLTLPQCPSVLVRSDANATCGCTHLHTVCELLRSGARRVCLSWPRGATNKVARAGNEPRVPKGGCQNSPKNFQDREGGIHLCLQFKQRPEATGRTRGLDGQTGAELDKVACAQACTPREGLQRPLHLIAPWEMGQPGLR